MSERERQPDAEFIHRLLAEKPTFYGSVLLKYEHGRPTHVQVTETTMLKRGGQPQPARQ